MTQEEKSIAMELVGLLTEEAAALRTQLKHAGRKPLHQPIHFVRVASLMRQLDPSGELLDVACVSERTTKKEVFEALVRRSVAAQTAPAQA